MAFVRSVGIGAALLAAMVALAVRTGASAAQPASCSAASLPDQQHDEDTIRRLEQAWLSAELHGDAPFLDCLLEPDYRVSDRSAKVRSKQDLLDRVRQVVDRTREVPKLETLVTLSGDAAFAHSILRSTDKAGNAKEVHFVDAYTFRDGRWYAFSGADL